MMWMTRPQDDVETLKSIFTPLLPFAKRELLDLMFEGADYFLTPLHMAAKHGSFAAAGYLLDNGANIDAECEDNLSPLQVAVCMWRDQPKPAMVQFLLDRGANIDHRDTGAANVLMASFEDAYRPYMRVLLENGAKLPDSPLGDGCSHPFIDSMSLRSLVLQGTWKVKRMWVTKLRLLLVCSELMRQQIMVEHC
eukprot:m.131021 g.131021  ORF g.131021 m.131021 type:complete len:194 (+) comp15897_c0_seq8:116-697(+)